MSSSMMLFDGIPEAKRQRFSSLAMEAPLSSTSTSGGSSGLDFRDGSVGISEDRRVKSVLGQCEHHDTDLRKLLFNRWKQSFNCEVGIFVRCSASKKDFMEEFRGLPVTYYPDGLALVRIHGVVGSMSPLLASMQQAARRRVRVEKNAEESRKRRRTEDVAADLTTGESVGSASSVNSENGTGKPDGVPAGTSLMIPNLEARLKSGSLNLLEEGLIFFSLDISVIEGCAFIRAVNYLYTGTLRLCDVTISETLRACRFLGLQGGIDLCVNYLLEKLQPCNALSICALGNLFNCGTLEEMADEYLSDHFMEVTNDVEWRELAFDAVQRLLSRDNLKCDSEASVVRALYQWASYNRTNETHPRLSQVLESDFTKPDPSPSSPTHTDSNQSGSTSSRNPDQAEISKEERKNKDDKDIEVEDRGAEADDEDDDVNDDDDDDEDEDDDDIDDDDDDEEENREEAFAKMLSDGSIRFAHLSDDEITMLTEEIQQASPALHELWLQAVDKERLKRDKRQEKVKRTMQKDTKMASNDCDAGEEEDEEVEDMDDEDDDERSVPNLRRYNTAAGCQVEGASCVATLEGHGGYVYAVSELKDGSLVSGSRDQTIRVWDMKENCMATFDRSDGIGPQPLILEKHSDRVFGLVVLSSGKLASCSFDQTICIWNTSNWECEKVLSGHEGWVVAIAECCGKLVSGAADNLLKVWDVESGTCIKTLEGHSDHVYGVCAIADVESGRPLLASGSQDCTVKLWDPQQDWKELRTLKGHKGSIRSIKQCGRYLASASADRTIRLWMCTGKSLGKAAGKLIGHSDVVESLASISLAGAHHPVLASASRDNSIKIWNTLTKCCIRTLVGHRNWVKSLFYLSNGRLASASADGTVRVWDLQSH